MSALPTTLRLCGFDWSVRVCKIKGALGLSDHTKRQIKIAPGQDPLDELDTVLHELMHSTLRSQGRDYDAEPEELYVRALATGLTGVLADNPQLLEYIISRFKP